MSLLLKLFGIGLFIFLVVLGFSVIEFIKWINMNDDEYVSNSSETL